ncbi:DUF4214 domain-containing protein [Noviherbaspirillum galbum]|uniref:DUF4214 domain-containing protein n=1 Tax=Noviherbaspirillum galbum TaxID=2709383 RepID=A0A6B3SM57_9BURK|nr:DUF4214 domain-containing protein [Noviherbaspirillum galbum]NEX61934.1 DUF4214 domain-containing protein [Noviherbaspirillum galbum]
MSLVFEQEPNNTTPNTLKLGDTVRGVAATISDVDRYQFIASAGGILKLDFGTANSTANAWSYSVSIYDANNKLVAGENVGYGFGKTVNAVLSGAGTYKVYVYASKDGLTGTYDLTASMVTGTTTLYESGKNTTQAAADTIVAGQSISGQLNYGWGSRFYKFATTSSGSLELDFTPPNANTYSTYDVNLLDAAGKVVATGSTGSALTLSGGRVTQGATYYVEVKGKGYDSGNFTLSEQVLNPATISYKALTAQSAQTGEIKSAASDYYKVDLVAGTTYIFGVKGSTSSGGTLADPKLTLFDANLLQLESCDNLPVYTTKAGTLADPQIGFTATSTGSYYLAVAGSSSTGTYTITEDKVGTDTAIASLLDGARWNAGSPLGTPVKLTYSFLTSTVNGYGGFAIMTAAQKDAVRTILASYAALANLSFTEVADSSSSQLRLGCADLQGTAEGITFFSSAPSGAYTSNKILMEVARSDANYVGGMYTYEALIHEIGHSLGLKHPGNYNGSSGVGEAPFMPLALDNRKFTDMSYVNDPLRTAWHSTPGLYDIASIQYLYGVNAAAASPTQSFTVGSTAPESRTLFSTAPGATLDAGNQCKPVTISLTPGTFSSVGVNADGTAAHDNISIAFGSTFTGAIGGAGNDVIVGNDLGDRLAGGAGNDTVTGGAGDDTIVDFSGADWLDGGGGKNTLALSATSADLNAAADAQLVNIAVIDLAGAAAGVILDLHLQSEAIAVNGSAFNDIMTPSAGGGKLAGGAGDDVILGVVAGLVIDGGTGTNTLRVTQTSTILNAMSDDQLVNVQAVDLSNAGAGVTLDLHLQTEAINVVGGGFDDTITLSRGGGRVDGGSGSDTLLLAGSRTQFSVTPSGSGYLVKDKAGSQASATLSSVEKLKFIDMTIALGTAVDGTAGNDKFNGTAAFQRFSGGDGVDLISYGGKKADFVLEKTADGYTVSKTGGDGGDTLSGVERLVFTDTALALDIDGNGGKVYRLYQAAFNRKPDSDGLGWQLKAMDDGTPLNQISQNFVSSAEFKSLYGSNPSTVALVNLLYQNVLHRTPQQFETDFWVNIVDNGVPVRQTAAEVLASFSESPENQAQVIGSIQNGMEYHYYA